ncbi:MAG: sigma 54-interacting transcriptional regulator [Acidobacteriota bacterium]
MPDETLGSGGPNAQPSELTESKLFAAYSSSAAICILDAEGRFVWVNHEFAVMSGVPASEHFGKTLTHVLGSIAQELEHCVRRARVEGQPILNAEIRAMHPIRRTEVQWRLHLFPIRQDEGNARVGIVASDLTEEKKLARAVEELNGKLHKEMNWLHVLADINNLLSSNWDIAFLFPRISAYLRRVLRQEMAAFLLYDTENDNLVRHALDFPLSKGLLAQSPVSGKGNPAKQALDAGVGMVLSRKELETLDSSIARSLLAEGLQSVCCLPMTRPQGPLGVLVLGSTRPHAFVSDDMVPLTQVSSQLSLAMQNHLAASEIKLLQQRLGEERKYLEGEIEYQGHFTELVGDSPALTQVLQQVLTVAASGATVLIQGETGTGKELIARAIHRLSQRKDAPFIRINCAAIPTGLLESELFGHEKGAFTGAISQKIGRMELANGGTLFLDEIGEIPLELQPKLLRVLQDQEFERLGSNRTIKVDMRVVAATNRNLAERIAQNQFRSDLYYRLSVFPILVPPLRQRKEDIPLLVRYFVRQISVRMDRHIESIPPGAMDALLHWHWPGNVRELENLMERSVILSEGPVLRIPVSELRSLDSPEDSDVPNQNLDYADRQHIVRVLRETRGKISGPNGAAIRLGLKRTTLQSKMQRLGITRQEYMGKQP